MDRTRLVTFAGLAALMVSALVWGWTPVPVALDAGVFMPGSQPGQTTLESVTRCDNCHGGYDTNAEPAWTWRGSMMAQAGRDPLWLACLAVADQDSIWVRGNANAGDLCIRCHSPSGWLGGRSDPPNASALSANQKDFEGVSCDLCHRMVDPKVALAQPDVPPETNPAYQTMAANTSARDHVVMQAMVQFDGSSFYNSTNRLPVHYGDGTLPHYVEAASGQYFIDPDSGTKRAGRPDVTPPHAVNYSRFHKSREFCAACHDVSNPVLANAVTGPGTSTRQAAASYFHVERTWSEFAQSAYGRSTGAVTGAPFQAAGIRHAASCQSCHMPRVTGKLCNKTVPTRTDMAQHDFSGGNAWMLRILASVDSSAAGYDAFNYSLLSGTRYAGARIDVAGLQGLGPALRDGATRAESNLRRAATLHPLSDTPGRAQLRILNHTGHKLPSGFPEGRRIWLNVRFVNSSGAVLSEINQYTPLVVSRVTNGPPTYVSGGVLSANRPDLIYEAEMGSSLTGEAKSFHFVLATHRHKDNRIPPRGFDIVTAPARQVQPRWAGADAPDYFTAEEYALGCDDVDFAVPPGAAGWEARLFYQTTSREYAEFLRDEINGTAPTLPVPGPSGVTNAYIVQSDPFFTSLKDWGRAVWELWLANGGSAPVELAGTLSPPRLGQLTHTPGTPAVIRFDTIVGRTYRVQVSSNLTEWTTLGGPVAGTGTPAAVTDSGATAPHRFYRVIGAKP